jgi:hypothetical protein
MHADVQVLLGETSFKWDAFRHEIDTPGSVSPQTRFLLGSTLGTPAVYEVAPAAAERRRFGIFAIASPVGFK